MLKAISLYTGAGGLDFGFEAAGFSTVVAVEMDKTACCAVRANRPEWNLIEGDIHDIDSSQILDTVGLHPSDADILIGGPPCQPFSKSSYWVHGDARRMNDPRAGTLKAYLRVLRDTLPRVFLLENVHGIAYSGKEEGLRYLLSGIEEINRVKRTRYRVHWKKLNAAHFGVPQLRERVFLIANRDGAPFEFPQPTHGDSGEAGDLIGALEPYRTCWDALGDLPEMLNDPALVVGGRWGDLLPTIPEGRNYLWHTNRGEGQPLFGWRRRYWSFLLKLKKCRPSWTIQAQPGPATGPFHWKSRRLSALEMSRLQTFPDGLAFDSSRGEVQKMLGNAVPSLLAEVLARSIRAQLLGDGSVPDAPRLLPPVRDDVPDEEPYQTEVPERYAHLIGDHPDHPGTGRGHGAVRRAFRPETA